MNTSVLTKRPEILPTLAEQECLLNSWLPWWSRKGKAKRARITKAHDELFSVIVGLTQPQAVFEIGAHEASFSTLMARALPEADIFAFEANPQVFEEHRQRVTAAGVRYQNLAILDREGEAEFYVPITASGREEASMGSVHRWTRDKEFKSFRVNCRNLDSVAPVHLSSCCIWIDVEGAALQVLKSGPNTLRLASAIYLEIERETKWQGGSSETDTLALLRSAGLHPLTRDIQRDGWQYNVICVREELLANPLVLSAARSYLARDFSR